MAATGFINSNRSGSCSRELNERYFPCVIERIFPSVWRIFTNAMAVTSAQMQH
jgi:hypothetical protein